MTNNKAYTAFKGGNMQIYRRERENTIGIQIRERKDGKYRTIHFTLYDEPFESVVKLIRDVLENSEKARRNK